MNMIWKWINNPEVHIPCEISNVNDYLKVLWKTLNDISTESKITYEQIKENPFLLKDMDRLVERMIIAFQKQEKVIVFWDYDVDGVSWTAVMYKWLKYLWFKNLDWIAPTRDTWYSIKSEYIEDYISVNWNSKYPDLIITVDCWIKSNHEIDKISKEMMIDIIVTDHHLPWESLSKYWIAHVDPHRKDSQYPFKPMSWSFVALKVIEALNMKLPFVSWPEWKPNLAKNELQELAVLWIVADMMPIVWENKVLVKECIPRYIFSKNKWIQTFTKMLVNQNMNNPTDVKDLWPDLIWWQIWPRINAAKRMWDSTIPLDMLLSDDQEQINYWFKELDNINAERKDLVDWEKNIAFNQVNEIVNSWEHAICYISPETNDWIIWLIAWKLKEYYWLPTIVIWWYKNWILKWSCRSVEWVHILNILDKLSHYLLGYWWHAMAAWFSIKEENLEKFVNDFYNFCKINVKKEDIIRKKYTYWYIRSYWIIQQPFLNVIKLSAPYWMWNPEPEFVILWKVKYVNFMWKNEQHLKITITDSQNEIVTWICFNYERIFFELKDTLKNWFIWQNIWLVWTLWLNEYNGIVNKQVSFNDIIILNS